MIDLIRRRYMGSNIELDENSYIQDGLVFQLDGINKGSNEGKWTDLVGGVQFTIPESANLTEETNGFTWTGDVNMSPSSGIPHGKSYTVEIALKSTRSGSSQKWGCFADGNVNDAGRISIAVFNSSLTIICRTASISSASLYTANTFVTVGANSERAYLNKNEMVVGTSYATPNKAGIGNTYSYGGMRGTIYAVRIYNRALTAAELLLNQDIDIKRFGT